MLTVRDSRRDDTHQYIQHKNKMKSQIVDILDSPNWVIFTSENPNGEKLSFKENEHLYNNLLSQLKEDGSVFEEIFGHYNGNNERSVIVFTGMPVTREFASDIAKEYQQECVLTKDGFVYQDGSLNPSRGISYPLSTPEDNYSIMRSTYFTVDIDFDTLIKG